MKHGLLVQEVAVLETRRIGAYGGEGLTLTQLSAGTSGAIQNDLLKRINMFYTQTKELP